MSTFPCPDDDRLNELLLGLASSGELDDFAQHLEECAACDLRSKRMDHATDSLLKELRDVHQSGSSWDQPPAGSTDLSGSNGTNGSVRSGGSEEDPNPVNMDVDDLGLPGLGKVIAGRYVLREVLGEGGMGTVFLANQKMPMKRSVALKVIKSGHESRKVLARFEAERQALALMDHPNIAHVYDGGTTESGKPFFVMELVNGVSITDYCKSKQLSLKERMDLFEQVCDAVQHAHQKGIIHRDLKPKNILVTEVNGRAVSKVIDFGVAKATGFNLTDQTLEDSLTIVGTFRYMAPEQAGPKLADVDTRADIYALGAILYELLTGSGLFEGDTPAQILHKLVAEAPQSPRLLVPGLQKDLETICLKCLEKDRDKRYNSASLLASDVRAFLEDRPISARPITTYERGVRWARRKPVEAALALVSTMALLGLALGMVVFIASLKEQNDKLVRSAIAGTLREAEEQESLGKLAGASQTLLDMRQEVSPKIDPGFAYRALWHRVDRRLSLIELQDRQVEEMHMITQQGKPRLAVSYRNQNGMGLWDLVSRKELARVSTAGMSIRASQSDPSSLWVFSSEHQDPSREKLLQRFGLEPLKLRTTFELPEWVSGITSVEQFNGSRLLIACGGTKHCEIRDATTFELLHSLELDSTVFTATTSPDGQSVAIISTSSPTGESWIYLLKGTATGYEVQPVIGEIFGIHSVKSFVFSPDGRQIAVATDHESKGGVVQIVDLATRTTRVLSTAPGAGIVAFSPDGSLLAYGVKNGVIEIRSVAEGKLVQSLSLGAFVNVELAFSPDGQTLYCVPVEDPRIWCWHLNSEGRLKSNDDLSIEIVDKLPPVSEGQDEFELYSVSFSPDSQTLALGGENGVLWVGPRSGVREKGTWFQYGDSGITALSYLEEGRLLALGTWDQSGNILIVDPANRRIERTLRGHKDLIRSLAVSPDGRWLASGSRDGTARLWDLKQTDKNQPGRVIKVSKHEGSKAPEDIRCLAFSPDSRLLAIGDNAFELCVYEITSDRMVYSDKGSRSIHAVTFSPRGDMIASGDGLGTVTLLTWPGRQKRILKAHSGQGGVMSLAFHPDGKELASGGVDGSVAIWDIVNRRELLRNQVHTNEVRGVAFAPDGSALASVDQKGVLYLLEAPEPVYWKAKTK